MSFTKYYSYSQKRTTKSHSLQSHKTLWSKCATLISVCSVLALGLLQSSTALAVQGPAPINLSPPSISGSVGTGQVITGHLGTWQSDVGTTYSYQWILCAAVCAAIPGATTTTYTIPSTDINDTLRFQVTAVAGVGGIATIVSNPTPLISSVPTTIITTDPGTGDTGTGTTTTTTTTTSPPPVIQITIPITINLPQAPKSTTTTTTTGTGTHTNGGTGTPRLTHVTVVPYVMEVCDGARSAACHNLTLRIKFRYTGRSENIHFVLFRLAKHLQTRINAVTFTVSQGHHKYYYASKLFQQQVGHYMVMIKIINHNHTTIIERKFNVEVVHTATN